MPGHCLDLFGGAAGIDEPRGAGLAQPVIGALLGKPGFVAAFAKPVLETSRPIRDAKVVVRNVMLVREIDLSACISSGSIGSVRAAPVFSWRTVIVSPSTCCQPMRTTSEPR